MQMRIAAVIVLAHSAALAEDARVETSGETPAPTELRLTLSSFFYRETGDSAPPLVDMGEPVASASPVRRYFGDLRVELVDGGFAFDGRVRETASGRAQSGATGGGEYELRTLRLRVGSERTTLDVGRQTVDAVAATKIDGLALARRIGATWTATAFGGAMPALGSRSVDTDYDAIVREDGTRGSPLVPVVGGLGASYRAGTIHGDLGAAVVYALQDVPKAAATDVSRVFVSASGYTRPARWLDVYHFLLADVAGGAGANLTNGTLGVTAHPTPQLQLSAQANHVSTDLYEIAAQNTLADPDPSAVGIVQNDIAIVRVSQDQVRGGASLALVRGRFEISGAASLRRRPEAAIARADGGSVVFPENRSVDVTLGVVDRRSIGGLRVSLTASSYTPLGEAPNRSRGAYARLAAGRTFARERGEIEVDVAGQRARDLGGGTCSMSTDLAACFGHARTTAAQAGLLASWRVGREWLVLADVHGGAREVTSGMTAYPTAFTLTAFARLAWRYR